MHVFVSALLGGLLIGLAASLMMFLIGRIAGVSGIASKAIRNPRQQSWSLAFLLGLVIGTSFFHNLSGASAPQPDTSATLLIISGLLVGLGTRLASGCTSGHGICGIARLSTRSLVAVAAFMITAMVTVFLRFQG